MSVKWIPTDPNTYLHPDHRNGGHPMSVDWQSEYARWCHSYVPAYSSLVNQVLPNTNPTQYIKLISSLIPVAVELIPDGLKGVVYNNHPDDWSKLPDKQIRRIWDNEAALFSNITLMMTCLQIIVLIKKEMFDGYRIYRDLTFVSPGEEPSVDRLQAELLKLEALPENTSVFESLSLYPAIFQLAQFDSEFWTDLLSQSEKRTSFMRSTMQAKDTFVDEFCAGKLITLPTSREIENWIRDEVPEIQNFRWTYHEPEGGRMTAAKGELVTDYPKRISLTTVSDEDSEGS